jgi:CelD/BcsL family acetyltransferase involved in cellulose biosynthesis
VPCITEINDADRFFELRHVWNSVLDKCRDKNVFLTWEYLSTCWKHFGNKKKLRILVVEDENRIIGIAPLRQSRYSLLGSIGYSVIEPLGYRFSDYTGLILAEKESECLTLLLNYLIEHDHWDFAYMFDVPETSVITELLPSVSRDVLPTISLKRGVKCPYISLPNSIDVLTQGLSKNLRQNLRKYARKLKQDGYRVEIKKYEDFGSVENAMTVFFKLHQERWESKHMPGAFDTQKIRDFHIDVAKQFANKGWLTLYFMMANDEPVAATYNYSYNQKMYYVLGGFDPDYSKYSVGHLLHQRAIEDCILNKIEEYDFLKGDEPYKRAWTKEYRRNLNIRFVNKRFSSDLCDWAIRTIKKTKTDRVFGKFLNL